MDVAKGNLRSRENLTFGSIYDIIFIVNQMRENFQKKPHQRGKYMEVIKKMEANIEQDLIYFTDGTRMKRIANFPAY